MKFLYNIQNTSEADAGRGQPGRNSSVPNGGCGGIHKLDGILKQKDSHVVPNTGRNPYEM